MATQPGAPHLRSVEGGATTGAAAKAGKEPYDLAPAFEAAVVAHYCGAPLFWEMGGALLEPDCLIAPEARLLVKAAKEVADPEAGMGRPPGAALLVLQRLARWRGEGKVTQEQLEAAGAYLERAEDAGLPDVKAVAAELAPLLRRRMQREGVQLAIREYQQRGDLAKAEALFRKAREVGVARVAEGGLLGLASFERIAALRLMQRLPTGVPDLDHLLGGGTPRGLTVFVGGEKSLKSMTLSHGAAENVYQGAHVAVATLELQEELWQARVIAALTGVAIDDVLAGQDALAKERLEALLPRLGVLQVRYFQPQSTTVDLILDWSRQREEEVGRKVDLLIVDYVGKVKLPKGEDAYRGLGSVSDVLRDDAIENKRWCWTAAQSKRTKDKRGKRMLLDTDDVADSLNLIRNADLGVALRRNAEEHVLDFFVGAGRVQADRAATASLPTDEARGRVAPVVHEEGW